MDEVDRNAVDACAELTHAVDPTLLGSPIEPTGPVCKQAFEVRKISPLPPRWTWRRHGPTRRENAPAKVAQHFIVDVDEKGFNDHCRILARALSRRRGCLHCFHCGKLADVESTRGPIAKAIDEDRLSETFAVLANSTRRAILARLAQGEATVNELAKPFDLTLPAVSKHIKVLAGAGLVVRSHRAQYRPCAIDATPLQDVLNWTERYRPIWESRFDRMSDYLMQLGRQQEAGKQDD